MKKTPASLFWFRQDLRLTDNPGLLKAIECGTVLPVYILDTVNAGVDAMGGASKWWMHHSLESLNRSLGGHLNFYAGDPQKILLELCQRFSIEAVFWNRCYEPWQTTRDTKIKEALRAARIKAESSNASLLWEPWNVLKADGTPYKVFTPFYRRGCLSATAPRKPLPVAEVLATSDSESLKLSELGLLPKIRWDKQLAPHWDISEKGAQKALESFLDAGIDGYKEGRNFPSQKHTSRLSPYLHSGEISPHQVWHAALKSKSATDVDHFCSELGWREFSYSLLHYFPDLPRANWQAKFDAFPWKTDKKSLERWQKGQTGYPIVDAGMRELWQTGYMHNRVRMIVGSFLVKNLLIDWREGAKWFWDCLVDADLANNSASWQWVAGSGADAAPYFRIFNPITQGEKFDEEGLYIRKYVPELTDLPNKYLFAPWLAPSDVLRSAGITLGITYPRPLVDAAESRERALEAFAQTKMDTSE